VSDTNGTTYRVAQWATGSIGQIAIRHFAENPVYELVGVYVTNPDKIGKDAGELAGIGPTGVLATGDIDAIIASGPDCVNYAPLHEDLDDMCRLLDAGINIVTPVGFVYPSALEPAVGQRLAAACRAGGSSLHGSGIHPGFSGDLLPLTFARLVSRIDQIQVREVADLRLHPSAAMFQALGFARDPIDAVENPSPLIETMERIFQESMTMVVEGLGQTVERFTTDFEVAVAKRDLHVRAGLIPAGHVAGMHLEWKAWADGRPLVVFRTFWKMDDDLDPDWGFGSIKYNVIIDGDPSISVSFESARKHPDGDEGYWGRMWTAMNAVNAIPTVVDADPGILTHLDLPFLQTRGLVRPATDHG
jgi:hypothetical protein